jgi:hypothetical protein
MKSTFYRSSTTTSLESFLSPLKLHRGVQTRQVKIDGMDLNHIVAIKESVLHALISTVHTIKYKGKPINDVN